jgi:hypothetical protein
MDKLELRFRAEDTALRMDGIGAEGEILLLENMRERDKAFNTVIGFSGLRWQHLQQRPRKKKIVPAS